MKPKILICVLCSTERNGWINPALCMLLLSLQKDPRFDFTVEMAQDLTPVEYARNCGVAAARQRGASHLLMLDNDNVPPHNLPDIIDMAIKTAKPVVTLGYGCLVHEGPRILPQDNGRRDGQFRVTGHGCGGVLLISAEVWRKIPGPWFRWLTNDDETGSRKLGEDTYFLELVQQHGFSVWTHDHLAQHLKTVDATAMICRMAHATK